MNLKDKTILITGATDGIGKATAEELAEKGSEIIIHGRNEEKILNTVNEIKKITDKVFGIKADFADLEQVNKAAEDIKENFDKIDILFNNAAEYMHDKQITKNNFERTFQVNYLAHFLITEKLQDLLKKSEKARIINVSSMIHSSDIDFDNLQAEKNYNGSAAYSLSKLLNILHTYKLARLYEKEKISVNCLHPGVIETKLLNAAWSGGMPVSEGAANMIYAAESEAIEGMTGLYLENRRPMQSNPVSYNVEIQDKLYDISKEMLKSYL